MFFITWSNNQGLSRLKQHIYSLECSQLGTCYLRVRFFLTKATCLRAHPLDLTTNRRVLLFTKACLLMRPASQNAVEASRGSLYGHLTLKVTGSSCTSMKCIKSSKLRTWIFREHALCLHLFQPKSGQEAWNISR